jgi:hypothetical protein
MIACKVCKHYFLSLCIQLDGIMQSPHSLQAKRGASREFPYNDGFNLKKSPDMVFIMVLGSRIS